MNIIQVRASHLQCSLAIPLYQCHGVGRDLSLISSVFRCAVTRCFSIFFLSTFAQILSPKVRRYECIDQLALLSLPPTPLPFNPYEYALKELLDVKVQA